jgi:hypothetical protein
MSLFQLTQKNCLFLALLAALKICTSPCILDTPVSWTHSCGTACWTPAVPLGGVLLYIVSKPKGSHAES